MNQIISFLLGSCDVVISGAAPQQCINALPKEKLTFWNIRFLDEMHISFSVLSADAKRLSQIAIKNYCTVEQCRKRGLPVYFRRLLARPMLLISMAIVIGLSFFLPSFVWVIEVKGNETVPTERIVRKLEEMEIRFGAWASSIDSQETKHRMLNAVPELSWLAVNRTGGKLTVLVTERKGAMPDTAQEGAVHIVAAKDGVITDYSICEGMKLCARGDTVKKGQILVSGVEDYGLIVRNVRADAEIYATTWYSGTVIMPKILEQKVYTGREFQKVYLRLGRKRIKLFGNSSNCDVSCDKMIVMKQLTLPGYTFPVWLEREVYREYTRNEVSVLPQEAQQKLREAWKRETLSKMIAGKIETTAEHFSENPLLYILQAQSTCTEMIAKPAPMTQPDKGDTDE